MTIIRTTKRGLQLRLTRLENNLKFADNFRKLVIQEQILKVKKTLKEWP